jgi:hypothetical protein
MKQRGNLKIIKYPYIALAYKMDVIFLGHRIATLDERAGRTWNLRYHGSCPHIDPYGGSTFPADTVDEALDIVTYIVNRVYVGNGTYAEP